MGGVATRDEILAGCGLTILAKPLAADLRRMKTEGILWGWAHCVQQYDIAQAAIDRKLTLVTWEGMNSWGKDGEWVSHVFYRNNEIAGYAGVLHAFGLKGIDGEYGPIRKAAVINFGSVGQGAVRALLALGFTDITLYVLQEPASLGNVPPGVKVVRMADRGDGHVAIANAPFINELEKMDVIVNGMLQDPVKPLTYLAEHETGRLKHGALIIDVSCDEGMGFPFARPTNFEEPMIPVGVVHYYAVDHTPTYLWNSASWEISKALLPYLRTVMSGRSAWEQDETVRRAIEIREGVILNPQILSFQKRDAGYPHKTR
jgi:alanine dehydrogenase